MADDILARARAALEGVTEGPWEVNREGWAVISSSSDSVLHGYFEGDCDNCCYPITAAASVAISIENVTFIAEARTLIPELLAEVERLRGALETLMQQWKSQPKGKMPYVTPANIADVEAVLLGDQ